MSRRFLLVCRLSFGLLVCGWASVVSGQTTKDCAVDSEEVYDVRFTEISNSPQGADCGGFLRCYLAEQPGAPFLRRVPPTCDPMSQACRVDLVVPLLFKGAHQSWASSFISPLVLWFESATPPDDCMPWIDPDCDDTASCGTGLGGPIIFDRVDVFLSLTVGCSDLSSEDLRTYSLSAFSCPVGSACPKNKKVSGLDFTPQAVAAFLGCPTPRTDDCDDCLACRRVGPGGANVGGGGSTAGGPGTGPEALLWYAAGGGAGEAGLPGSADWNVTMGRYWSHSYAQRIVRDPDDTHVWLITDRATFREFGDLDVMTGEYVTLSPSDEYRTLERTVDGWKLTAPDGTVMAFDDDGLWRSTTERNAANATTAVYTGTRLDEVHFPDGRREEFTYYPIGHASEGKLETITEVGVADADSRAWTYTWSGDDLVRIDRPDDTAWVMEYSTDPDLAGYLTRILLEPIPGSTEPDRVLAAWEYDAAGNVAKIWRGADDFDLAVDRWAFSFDDPVSPTETVVTDPLGAPITYTLERDPASEKPRVTRIEGDCPTCSLGPNSQIVYDGDHPLRPEQITDGNGNVTRFTYNEVGEVLTRTEAFGDPTFERTTTWTYNSTYKSLVESMVQESVDGTGDGRQTVILRDSSGNETQRTVNGVEGGTWDEMAGQVTGASAFTYTAETMPNAAGLPLWIDPHSDPGGGSYGSDDRTTFTYDGDRGDLVPLTRTDPQVGTTQFTHDPFNRRTHVTDANGVVTETAYDELDRVTAVIRQGAIPAEDLTTVYERDDYGDLFRIHLPEGNFIEHLYDDAGRLTETRRWNAAQTAGERVRYVLDRAGNRMREEHSAWDPMAATWAAPDSTTDYFYETRCRLDRVVQDDGTPEGAVTEYDYDCNGNLERVWDASHPSAMKTAPPTTTYAYDALDRLTAVARPWDGPGGGTSVTGYGYDHADRQEALAVEHDAVTTNVVTGAGYLPNGPLASLALGNGTTETRSYDDRYLPEAIALAAPRNRDWDYETDKIGNVTEIVSMGDCAGDVTLTELTVAEAQSETSCAALTAGPDVTVTATGDLDLVAATRVALENGFRVENGGRLAVGTDPALSGDATKCYTYQDFDYFLKTALGPWGSLSWTYDKIGNRLTEDDNGWADTYHYAPNGATPVAGNTAKLESIDLAVGIPRTFDHTDAGHQTVSSASGNAVTFTYDDSGRLVEADRSGSGPRVPFVYDGRSFLRTAGNLATTGTVTATYDSAGLLRSLLRQENVAAAPERYHLFYLAGRPVAQFAPDTGDGDRWWFFTTDHLVTPLLATAADGTEIWESRFEPFGEDGKAGTAQGALENEVFLRFPGQWEDGVWGEATMGAGMYQNLHRWYTYAVGKYSRPDPLRTVLNIYSGDSLALVSGNTLLYAASNPAYYIDPSGLTLRQGLCVLKYALVGALGGAVSGAAAGCAAGAGVGVFVGGVGALPGCGAGVNTGASLGGLIGANAGAILGTIECRCESDAPDKPEEGTVDCSAVRQYCIDKCTEETLPTGTYDGAPFYRCYAECKESFGC